MLTKPPSFATGTFPRNIISKSWSDARAYDGTVSIVQPLIEPLYDGKNAHEVVQLFFRENFDKKDYDIVKEILADDRISQARRERWRRPPTQSNDAEPRPKRRPQTTARTPSASCTRRHRSATTAATDNADSRPRTPGSATRRTAVIDRRRHEKFRRQLAKVVHDGFVPNTAAPAKRFRSTPHF